MKRRSGKSRARAGACATVAACLVFLLLTVALSGCTSVTGSGNLVTTQLHESGFTEVQAADAWTVSLVRGDIYSVKVTTDDNLVDRLDVTVEGSALVLRLKSGTSTTNATLKATVVMPTLSGLDLADASDASVSGFSSGDPLTVSLHDSSSATLNSLHAGTLTASAADASSISGSIQVDEASLHLSDASDAELSGVASQLTVQASDSSSADLGQLRAENVNATLSDASSGTVAVSGMLEAHLSDGSDLKYIGSPQLGAISINDDSSLVRVGP